jgi:N-glycosidase YbiA
LPRVDQPYGGLITPADPKEQPVITAHTEQAFIPASSSDPVLFSGGIPSNFYQATIVLPDPFTGSPAPWATTEHYFQAAKVAAHYRAVSDYDSYMNIADAPTAGKAKTRARRAPLDPGYLQAWNNGQAFLAMLTCVREKFRAHPECAAWLHATGTRRVVEHRPDPVWGDNLDGTGRNQLGLVLMLVRAELAAA